MKDPYLIHLSDQVAAATAEGEAARTERAGDRGELVGLIVEELHALQLGCTGPAEECGPCERRAQAVVGPVTRLTLDLAAKDAAEIWPDPFGNWTADQADAAKATKEHVLRRLSKYRI